MDYAMPKQGEQLTLPDGRVFRFTAITPRDQISGWWWCAISICGKRTLQGNFKLKRRGLSDGWEQA